MPSRQAPPPQREQRAPVHQPAPPVNQSTTPPPSVAQPRQPGMFAQSNVLIQILQQQIELKRFFFFLSGINCSWCRSWVCCRPQYG